MLLLSGESVGVCAEAVVVRRQSAVFARPNSSSKLGERGLKSFEEREREAGFVSAVVVDEAKSERAN